MTGTRSVLAADVGAGSVKVFLVTLDGDRVRAREVDRFPNSPLVVRGHLYDDVGHIYDRLKRGLAHGMASADSPVLSVGIDTFGNDYGLLDRRGELVGMPHSYRDRRTAGAEALLAGSPLADRRTRYRITGIAPAAGTAYSQLLADAAAMAPAVRDQVDAFLMLPDLLGFFLTGEKASESVTVSASALVDVATGDWSEPVLSSVGMPRSAFTDVVAPGTRCGVIDDPELDAFGPGRVPLVKVAGHDSGSAVVPLPLPDQDAIYLSSGSWSLVGAETDRPVTSDDAFEDGFSNQGLPEGRYRLQKAIPGLWVVQQCLKEWQADQPRLAFAELDRLVEPRHPSRSFVDVEQPQFSQPGAMTGKIRDYCRVTGQQVPESIGEVVACVYSSLALKYRGAAGALDRILGHTFGQVVIAGGGAHAATLCAMVASATSKTVLAGLADASALGNGLVQLISHGYLADLAQARQAVAGSFVLRRFEPGAREPWDAALATAAQVEERYRNVADVVRAEVGHAELEETREGLS